MKNEKVMKLKGKKWLVYSLIAVIIVGGVTLYVAEPEYAYTPPLKKVLPSDNRAEDGDKIDLWGQTLSTDDPQLLNTTEGRSKTTPGNGAIQVDDKLIELGRKSFYEETFGNEVFMTDIMGVVDGPFTIPNVMKAIVKLKGEGTTNLRVELTETTKIGDKTFKKGEKINTGLDVPKGSYTPLGMPVKFSEGRVKVGISCAACHATVDRDTKQVIEGAPNNDLNAGLLMALATNSTAYFTHTDIKGLRNYIKDVDRTVTTTKGKNEALPDPEAIEKAVDETLLKWPRGNFDSTIDMESNPAQIPDSFTLGDHPYGWSGFAAAGPFKGLSTFNNNVHAQNADALSQSEVSKQLFGIDKELYLGTLLQNAASQKYRYDINKNEKPSEFFASVDPTPGIPGVNELIAPPSFPKITPVAPDGLIASSPGFHVNEQNNGMAAWQNTLVPPKREEKVDQTKKARGREVFNEAGCIQCHAGRSFTNNRVISAEEIGTEPSRAKALKKTEKIFDKPLLFPPDTPVPVPKDAKVLNVPVDKIDPEQQKLAFAHGDSPGGYKVPSLIGLHWSAPYLHDGGVAAGLDIKNELGVTRTLMEGIQPDPKNSLRALVDKKIREKVIKANKANKQLQQVHVSGEGHEFWVDSSTGFSKKEQDALIDYLLSLESPKK
jgi:hypothetical protein